MEGAAILMKQDEIDQRKIMQNIVQGYPEADNTRGLLKAR
jgi:hypothetical protein